MEPPIQRVLPVNGSVTRAAGTNVKSGATSGWRTTPVSAADSPMKPAFVPVTVLIAAKKKAALQTVLPVPTDMDIISKAYLS